MKIEDIQKVLRDENSGFCLVVTPLTCLVVPLAGGRQEEAAFSGGIEGCIAYIQSHSAEEPEEPVPTSVRGRRPAPEGFVWGRRGLRRLGTIDT